MGERKVLGLVYGYNESWIAGSYYIENLIACLLLIQERYRPQIKVYVYTEDSYKVLSRKDFAKAINIIQLKDAQTLVDRVINKISFWFTGKYMFVRGFDQRVDAIFPNPNTFHFHKMPNHIAWIPDFQEKYYPGFFPEVELLRREKYNQKIASNIEYVLVLSSASARKDFEKFYPEHKSRNYVIPFAVTIPSLSGIDKQSVLAKYAIKGDFFICSNQFWAHKGHTTLFRALREVKELGEQVKVVFTGKPFDDRNPEFFTDLMKMIEDYDLSECVCFLGFIPRHDQLVLMEQSLAILQPSQFEGWSTIVEDAKILNKSIVLSNLEIHMEQLDMDYEGFFEVNNEYSLARKIVQAIKGYISPPNYDYKRNQIKFGQDIITLLNDVS